MPKCDVCRTQIPMEAGSIFGRFSHTEIGMCPKLHRHDEILLKVERKKKAKTNRVERKKEAQLNRKEQREFRKTWRAVTRYARPIRWRYKARMYFRSLQFNYLLLMVAIKNTYLNTSNRARSVQKTIAIESNVVATVSQTAFAVANDDRKVFVATNVLRFKMGCITSVVLHDHFDDTYTRTGLTIYSNRSRIVQTAVVALLTVSIAISPVLNFLFIKTVS